MSFEQQNSYQQAELLACGRGQMFGDGNAQLPLPPMLMFDRITHISDKGGAYGRGEVIAELDINPELWFFKCHFEGDPVMLSGNLWAFSSVGREGQGTVVR